MALTKKCVSCGFEVLAKADSKEWKAVQVDPDVASLSWFCMVKEPCVDAFKAAVDEASVKWRDHFVADTVFAEPPPAEDEIEAPVPDEPISDRVVPIPPGPLVATEE